MNKKIIFFLLLLVSICAMSHVSAVDNITDNQISESSLDIQNCLSDTYEVNSSGSIQNTIDKANENDTIVLNGSFKLDKSITVDKSINIVGADDGATINWDDWAYSKSTFFIIRSNASNVVLSNLKFVSGITNGNAAAINWQGSNGSLNNCQFINNVAQGNFAGAVLLAGDNSNITNCSFSGNNANQCGGAIVVSGSNCLIYECSFSKNYASLYGGAIVVSGNKNKISKCNFTDNYLKNTENLSSIIGGGAIFSNAEGLDVDTCIFTGNDASSGNGGAIILGEYNTVRNSFFNDNNASLGKYIYGNSSSFVISSSFILDENKTKEDALYGFSDDNLLYNNYTIIKVNSTISFIRTGKIFTYGIPGSLFVTVKGGSLTLANIQVLNYPSAQITFSNNILTLSNLAVGKYTLRVTTTPDDYHYSVDSDFSITVNKDTAVIKTSKITVALKKSTLWSMTFVDSRGKAISNMKVTLKVYTGKKYKTVTTTTNSKGIAKYQTKGLSKGTHKVVVSASHAGYSFNTYTSSIKVIKQKALKFKVSKKTGKDGAQLSIHVLNKKTKKPLNGVKIKLLIYTGKTYKTITLKTKKIGKYKGVCGYATNKFSVGKHKVKIIPASIKYSGSKSSSMKITKKAKKIPAWETKESA